MPVAFPIPSPFLDIKVHHVHRSPSLCGLCVGYERGAWRNAQFVDHIVEWLPEFALSPEECQSLNHANALPFIRRAAKTIYESKKFENRGEFGELFLHAIVRQVHKSLPAISKIFYKSAINDTVKGFDAVHVVGPPDDMELWLGEAKFYDDAARAIRDVIAEIDVHLGTDYLRSEFLLLKGKIDDAWPHADALKTLLSPNTSLDEVFKRACIPVLLTYDSDCIAGHNEVSAEYIAAFSQEVDKHYLSFAEKLAEKKLPANIRVHLFLLPLHTKKVLIEALDSKLKAWQQV